MRWLTVVLAFCLFAAAAPKNHSVALGRPTVVKWFVGPEENQAIDLRIRPLYVDGRLKEYTFGTAHDVTERLFVVQRAYRVNDSLPEEKSSQWRWQRGSWLLVDKVSGKVTAVGLPEFDAYYSATSWYRDYAAYCGISDDGRKLFAIVAQLGRRKPLLKRSLGEAQGGELPDSECSAPTWERPARVTFAAKEQKFSYSVRGHAVDVIAEEEEGEE